MQNKNATGSSRNPQVMTMWRWTISRKLAALSMTGLVAAGAIGGVAYVNVRSIGALSTELNQLAAADVLLSQVDTKQSDIVGDALQAILSFTPEDTKATEDRFAKDSATFTDDLTALEQLNLPADLKDQDAALRATYLAYVDGVKTRLPALLKIPPGSPEVTTAMRSERDKGEATAVKLYAVRKAVTERSAQAEATLTSTINRVEITIVVVLLLGIVALIAVSSWISRLITRPIVAMVTALKALARKDLTVTVERSSNDEVGDMADSLNEALGSVREAVVALADSSSTLAAASEELGAVSTQLGHAAEETASQTDLVSASAQQVAGSVGSMSAATEEMTASISEIAGQATRASEVAGEAVRTAQETSEAVTELDRASAEIGEIVKVITSIAEQTNLLALNATIEAARAGDAGKGFAVVASEVKDLAQETSRATDDITSKISAIQLTTARATDAIGRISHVIAEISENQTTIAAAVEEQTATTSEISRNVMEISAGSSHMAGTIGHIAESAANTSSGAGATQQSAHDLSTLAQRVQDLVRQFTY